MFGMQKRPNAINSIHRNPIKHNTKFIESSAELTITKKIPNRPAELDSEDKKKINLKDL